MPDRQTVYNWLTENRGEEKDDEGRVITAGFFDHYTRAREIGIDEIMDETMEIADDGLNDFVEIEMKKGGTKVIFDKEAVMRSKLRVDTRHRYAENMAPRKYGRNVKVQAQTLDKEGNPTDPPMSKEAVDEFLGDILDAIRKHGEAP